jgi:hypothetical protein
VAADFTDKHRCFLRKEIIRENVCHRWQNTKRGNLSVDPSIKQGVTLTETFGQFEFDFVPGSVIFIAHEI